MKRITCLFICLVMILGFTMPCGSDESTPSSILIPTPPFPLGSSTDRETFRINNGEKLMQLMNVSDGELNLYYSSWTFPTSITVNTILYNVETGLVNTFNIKLADNCHSNVVDGYVVIKENEKEARIAAFAEVGSCSIAITQYNNPYVFSSPLTGVWRLGMTNYVEWALEAFISRNMTIIMRSATNSTDFALSLLNAGLPENEQIPLPPPQ